MPYPTTRAIMTLNRIFNLPATGREQDWDIELADPDRVSEFASYLEQNQLDTEEKRMLMALVLGSLEYLAQRQVVTKDVSSMIARLLRSDPAAYADLIERWRLDEGGDDRFAISGIIEAAVGDNPK